MNNNELKSISLDDIKKVVAKSDELLSSFSLALRQVVPELLRRVETKTEPLTLTNVAAWVIDVNHGATSSELRALHLIVSSAMAEIPLASREPVEVEEVIPFESAVDYYDSTKFDDAMSVHVNETMDEAEVAYYITDALDIADGAPLRVFVDGEVGRITLGGKTKRAITTTNGKPIGDIEFVGRADGERAATIFGLKFGGGASGIDGEVRLSGDLVVCPARNGDGTGMGDKASIATLEEMPLLRLVILEGVSCDAPIEWPHYEGFGYKWAVFLSGCTLVVDGNSTRPFAAPAREHTFYVKNMRFVFVERAWNDTRLVTDHSGVTRVLGNGRTFAQHSNRVHDVYPKGGDPSVGRIVFRDCVAHHCGWEGLLDGGKASGGSDFTCHGHTGESFELIDCESVNPYCGSIACWNEVSHKKKTASNPEGVRCWLSYEDATLTATLNPSAVPVPATNAHGTRRVRVEGFQVVGPRLASHRTPLLISGVRVLDLEGVRVNDDYITDDASPHLRLNHQRGVAPIGAVSFEA
jgi:hypothetical protein